MKIRVYQVDHDRDKNRIKFENHENTIKHAGSVNPATYNEVFSGDVDCISLENIYELFNFHHPLTHRGHSLSVSDVCEVIDAPIIVGRINYFSPDGLVSGSVDYTDSEKYNQAIWENKENGTEFKAIPLSGKDIPSVEKGCYFCDSVGFKKIDFDVSQTHKPENLLRVVMVEPNKAPYAAEVENKLDALQRAVGGGLIQVTYPFFDEDGTIIFSNDESKLIGMEGNRKIHGELYAGPLFIARDDGEGGTVSLTDELIEKYLERFKEPEQYTAEDVEDSIYFNFQFFG